MAAVRRRTAWLLGALAAALAVRGLPLPLAPDAHLVLAIVVLAMVLWVSEALPLGVTALAVSLVLVVLAGRDATAVFASYFDPVVVLLMGGFFLGLALQRHGLDAALAHHVLRRAGTRPDRVLLVVMGITGTFSMWVSNTATTAIMLPITVGILAAQAVRGEAGGAIAPTDGPEEASSAGHEEPAPPGAQRSAGRRLDLHDRTAKAFVLGVAAAANIGGVATPIGTPANPIALRFLADAGHPVSFLDWTVRAAPLAALLVVVAWWILRRVHPLHPEPLLPPPPPRAYDARQRGVMAVFFATVLLWLTTDLHGVAPAVVALVPVVALFALGLLGEKDVARIDWGVLLLIGGGIALGQAVQDAGLDAVLAGRSWGSADSAPPSPSSRWPRRQSS